MAVDRYPFLGPYGETGRVPRGGRRRTRSRRTRRTRRTRRMRGGDSSYVPQGGEMGTKPAWGGRPELASYNMGGSPPRGRVGGRRRRTMRGGYRLAEAAGAGHGYTLLGRMPPDNSGQR